MILAKNIVLLLNGGGVLTRKFRMMNEYHEVSPTGNAYYEIIISNPIYNRTNGGQAG